MLVKNCLDMYIAATTLVSSVTSKNIKTLVTVYLQILLASLLYVYKNSSVINNWVALVLKSK